MPKSDYLRRIDANQSMSRMAQPATAVAHSSGNADAVDGIHASGIPRPFTLLALDENARFPAIALPVAGLSGNQATGHHGVQYFGPTTYLARKCLDTDNAIYVTAPVLEEGDRAVISDYRTPSEHIYILSAAENVGGMWRYAIGRAKNDPRTQAPTTAQTHAMGAQVVSLGGAGGGHIYVVSAADDSEPYIQVRDNNNDADGATPFSTSWKTQFGNLSTIPQWFKDLFPEITNWDRWGFAGEDVFVSGGIYAKYGSIAGDLDVSGLLSVKETTTGAKLEFGDTVAGWGMAMRNSAGTPIWMLVSPYTDETGNNSEVAWVVQSMGKRAIYHRYDEASGEWILTMGGWDVSETQLSSGNGNIIFDAANEIIYIGGEGGAYFQWDGGIGAVRLKGSGEMIAHMRISAADIDTLVGGYSYHGVAGVTGTYSSPTSITVSGGIITAIS